MITGERNNAIPLDSCEVDMSTDRKDSAQVTSIDSPLRKYAPEPKPGFLTADFKPQPQPAKLHVPLGLKPEEQVVVRPPNFQMAFVGDQEPSVLPPDVTVLPIWRNRKLKHPGQK